MILILELLWNTVKVHVQFWKCLLIQLYEGLIHKISLERKEGKHCLWI